MNLARVVGVVVGCLSLNPMLALAQGRPVLPDLTTWADEARGYVHGWTIDTTANRTLLRLSTAMANLGEGPMEIRGGSAQPGGTQTVLQRIYNNDGTFTDRVAGTFVHHPTHNHVHFEDFATYNLRRVLPNSGVGEVVASGEKVSFCLLDLDDQDKTLVGAPELARYQSCATLQGISVGWADVYEEGLPDQWIDVTNVPHGQYWLEVIADPNNRLVEIDETNNAARILIDYAPVAARPRDAWEPNDSGEGARQLSGTTPLQLSGLSIHAPGNDDFFIWTAPQSGVLTATASFDRAEGDLNLFMYSQPAQEVGLGVSTGPAERLVVPVSAGQSYYIRAIGAGDDVIPNYSLSLSVGPEELVYPRDSFEPNNSRNRFTALRTTEVEVTDLSLHSVVDADYFSWIAPEAGTVNVSTTFSRAEGDLDLFLYNQSGNLLAASMATADGKELSLDVTGGRVYLIKVVGHEMATQPSYDLDVSFRAIPEPESLMLLFGGGLMGIGPMCRLVRKNRRQAP